MHQLLVLQMYTLTKVMMAAGSSPEEMRALIEVQEKVIVQKDLLKW